MSEVKRIKPALSKGTRDFLPAEVAKRNYIFETIKSVLKKYGFEEIETPAIERLETLTGKYGEEGDKLLFKILDSGDFLAKRESPFTPNDFKQGLKDGFQESLQNTVEAINLITPPIIRLYWDTIAHITGNTTSIISKQLSTEISEKGLRYDLTVPLARYVVQHQDNLAFPFRRFQIGPVWRADRPQKGRYQEFYQCDADVIGSTSLLNEVELTQIYAEVFKKLGLAVSIKLNNRKLIDDIFSHLGIGEQKMKVIASIDKIDKIGWLGEKGTKSELLALNIEESVAEKLFTLLTNTGYNELGAMLQNSAGAEEIKKVVNYFANSTDIKFEGSLMRGLDYYTGTIWEIELDRSVEKNQIITMGSLGGGGRYDNLTEMFGGKNMSGVGISFGIERIYDVMEELQLFPESISEGVKILLVPRNESVQDYTFQLTQTLRDAGISAEIFLGNVKKQKHFNYIENKRIAYVLEVGEDELNTQKFRLRNSRTHHTENDLDTSLLIKRLKQPD